MQHITLIRQMANDHLAQFNRFADKGRAEGLELQTEVALETLAELAYRLGDAELYRQITDRQHLLELHQPLALLEVLHEA